MPADFLQLDGKTVLIMGLANKKSVAWHAGQVLREAGAKLIWSVRTPERREEALKKLVAPGEPVLVCDVERQEEIDRLAAEVRGHTDALHGLVHSMAFANYSQGAVSFDATVREDFLQAVNISCFSLIAAAHALRPLFARDASVVTISISTTTMAAQNYGYMAPIKAALDSSIVFLAKAFGEQRVRFNAVQPGLLKTKASAGIPDYVPAYLFAEMATLRHEALKTEEVASTVAFLLSPRSSGINAQGVVLDAGMSSNYFDPEIVKRATEVRKG
ncbi:MAG: SDR family oxidoreductase [Planctomycetes bacterium]|nr:SDR family oxidoreductase [Planctomycetota bacterium]